MYVSLYPTPIYDMDKMDNYQTFILAETRDRQREIDDYTPSGAFDAHYHRRDQQNGPEFTITGWAGKVSPAERKRFERAVRGLESAGLIAVKRNGNRIGNIKLTPAGWTAAVEMDATDATDAMDTIDTTAATLAADIT